VVETSHACCFLDASSLLVGWVDAEIVGHNLGVHAVHEAFGAELHTLRREACALGG
jgi:hypothetical protein